MKSESIVFTIAGTFFGLIIGWVIGTQQAPVQLVTTTASAPAPMAQNAAPPASSPALDESQVAPLKAIAENDKKNITSRIQLGDLYFDARRYPEAMKWYEEALELNPKDANVSTDLAICYYYTDQAERAVKQMSASLAIDPKHLKTWLNLGVVRGFGMQDLAGAKAAWEEVLKLAPGSEEAASAQKMIDNMKAAHPGGTIPAAGTAQPAAGASPPNMIKK